ncbi:hypothetical protein [Bacillus niameyensis]|uniref:hypothetical protein n=1 Tax=Bacillus niameyensis TaxID=1522308 RepID=UPI000786346F|nr:hypothetical protein [Bacillus niameyensis]
MIGFIRYQCTRYIRSLKFIPPITIFFIWSITFYTYKGVPTLSSYGVSSVVIYLTMTWIGMSVFTLEEENEKQLLFTQLGSKFRFLFGKWSLCLLIAILLLVFAILYPIIIGSFKTAITPLHIGLSIFIHFLFSILGLVVGSFFSITTFGRKKYSWLAAMLINILSIVSEGMIAKIAWLKWIFFILPPVGKMMNYFSNEDFFNVEIGLRLLLLWGIIYTVIAFTVVTKMFIKAER